MNAKLALLSLLLLGLLVASQGDTAVDVVIGSGAISSVNGVTYPANPATDTVPTVTAPNTVSYRTVPDCKDDIGSGKHLNYDTTTHLWSCGNSSRTVPAFVVFANPPTTPTSIGPVDANTYNEVRVSEISGTANLDAPLGSPYEGQRLTYSLYCTTSRNITYTTTSGGFAGEAGLNLPGKCIAGSYLILEFRWSAQSTRWALVSVSDRRPKVVAFDLTSTGSSVTINTNTTELATIALGASAQASYTVNLSAATPYDGQILRVRFTTTAGAPKKPLVWDSAITNNAGMDLPTFTTGNGKEDDFAFQRNESANSWVFLGNSQGNQSALVKACVIALGDQVTASALTNAQLGPRIRQCPALGANGTVKEVGLYSDNGTPSIIPHRKSGASAAVDLVSGAGLTAGTGGTYACARIAGDTLSQNGATTCATTLQNTAYSGETSFGTTSGVAGGTATEVNVVIYYVPGG